MTTAKEVAFKEAWRVLEDQEERTLEESEKTWASAAGRVAPQLSEQVRRLRHKKQPGEDAGTAAVVAMVTDKSYAGAHVGSRVTMETVKEMISAFKNDIKLNPLYVARILDLAKRDLKSRCGIVMKAQVPADGRLVVVGDIHGQFIDLMTIFDTFGLPSEKNVFVMNGDFTDRGPHGIEVVLVLLAAMLASPASTFLNRGNHEQRHLNEKYSFAREVEEAYSAAEFDMFQSVFKLLPVVTVINGLVMVVHGGLPADPEFTIDAMASLKRINPHHSPHHHAELYNSLLWSDPTADPGTKPSHRGSGVEWGPDHTAKFLAKNKLSLIIRGHE